MFMMPEWKGRFKLVLNLRIYRAVVGNSIVQAVSNGKIECREYRWDYRVRHNSNTGTILLSDYKYRYFWVMINDGKSAFELRNDLRDGWVLSNAELIAHALGRS